MSDPHRISSVAELRTLYREPGKLVAEKGRPQLDPATTAFIEEARFLLLGTHASDGTGDVSPRGGPSGFMRVLDPGHLAISDLGGNNRLDSMLNIVDTGQVGLLVVLPGQSETVRINGSAWITTDPKVLDLFGLPRLPKSAIVVEVADTFVHCAKAFRRGDMWEPETWAALHAPDASDILVAQGLDYDPQLIREDLAKGYDASLRWEAGEDLPGEDDDED